MRRWREGIQHAEDIKTKRCNTKPLMLHISGGGRHTADVEGVIDLRSEISRIIGGTSDGLPISISAGERRYRHR